MKFILLLMFISLAILSFPAHIYVPNLEDNLHLRGQEKTIEIPVQIGAFHVGPGSEAEEVFNYLQFISPFWYTVTPDGSVIEHEFSLNLLNKIQANKVNVYPLVNLSRPKTNQIADLEWRQKVADKIADNVIANNFDGVVMDFEGLGASMTGLYAELLRAIKAKIGDKNVIVCLFPQVNWDKKNKEFLHPQPLAGAADYFVLMAYDWHWPKSKAGEIAPVSWVEENIKYTLQWIPASRLILGFPSYGYDWSDNKVKALGQREISELKEDVKPAEEGKIIYFDKGGKLHNVFYEPINNIEPKFLLAKKYGLKGLVWWQTGHSDTAFERAINQAANKLNKK